MPKQDNDPRTLDLSEETVNALVEEKVVAVGEVDDEIARDWADDYPAASELFCAKFDADDFDDRWTDADYSDGATVAVRRGSGMPPQGWILRNAHLSDLERTKAILEKHASADALAILYDLKDGPFDDFLEAWGKDGGMQPGKSNRSARRSASTKRR